MIPNRDALKDRTTALHAAAERQVWSADGFRSRAAYGDFLSALQQAHMCLGLPAAQRLDPARAVPQEHALLVELAEDLDHPAPDTPPSDEMSVGYAWGVRYALGGSALGAAVLLRSGHLPQGWPRRYLSAQAAQARSGQVRKLFDIINRATFPLNPAVEGANAVFETILNGVGEDVA